ncbi:MAG: hypothetical protein AAFN70_16680, partial [Planctomycetota bacterium]
IENRHCRRWDGRQDSRYRFVDSPYVLPSKYKFEWTHNVAVGSNGLVYIIHEGITPDHPSIFVFDENDRFVRAFGQILQGGGHGIEIRQENGEDVVYATAYQRQRSLAKFTTDGTVIWHKTAPMQATGYAAGEDIVPRKDNPWGRNRFMPTNIAFNTDGTIFVADGYGSYRVHQYDKDGNWIDVFGKPGRKEKGAKTTPEGTFDLPHGIWLDQRKPGEPLLVIADRSNNRLQWFTRDGDFVKSQDGYLLPCNFDIRDDVLVVPEYGGRITLLDKDDKVIVRFGDKTPQHQKTETPSGKIDKNNPATWPPGRLLAAHDACFDASGNILVAERIKAGRMVRLEKA